jgi:hypothetical protein
MQMLNEELAQFYVMFCNDNDSRNRSSILGGLASILKQKVKSIKQQTSNLSLRTYLGRTFVHWLIRNQSFTFQGKNWNEKKTSMSRRFQRTATQEEGQIAIIIAQDLRDHRLQSRQELFHNTRWFHNIGSATERLFTVFTHDTPKKAHTGVLTTTNAYKYLNTQLSI